MMEELQRHLAARRVAFDLHRPVLDPVEGTATFYMWNPSGQLVGFQQYRPSAPKSVSNDPRTGRYFTYRGEHLAVFGVESLSFAGPVFVVEGVFDACRFTQAGRPALAVLSNNPRPQVASWLRTLGRQLVSVTDGDRAGSLLAKVGHTSVSCPAGFDPADAPDDWFADLLARG